jgi:hypothetical protein
MSQPPHKQTRQTLPFPPQNSFPGESIASRIFLFRVPRFLHDCVGGCDGSPDVLRRWCVSAGNAPRRSCATAGCSGPRCPYCIMWREEVGRRGESGDCVRKGFKKKSVGKREMEGGGRMKRSRAAVRRRALTLRNRKPSLVLCSGAIDDWTARRTLDMDWVENFFFILASIPWDAQVAVYLLGDSARRKVSRGVVGSWSLSCGVRV